MDAEPRRQRRAGVRRVLVAVGVLVLAGVVALSVTGAVLGPVLPAATVAAPTPGPASIVPSAPAQRVVVDPLTHRLEVSPYLVGLLPGNPYRFEEPTWMKGVFTEATIGGVTGNPGWKFTQTLPPAIIVADVEPKAVAVGDLDATGRGLVDELGTRLYTSLTGLQVSDVTADPAFTIGALPAQWARGVVSGTRADGSAERAEIRLLLVALPNARHFAYVEIRPQQAHARPYFAAMDAAAASLRPAP